MSCTITPDLDPKTKIDIMMSNEAMNMYRRDYYGISTCKIGYDYSYLADLKLLLEVTSCAIETSYCTSGCATHPNHCTPACSNTQIRERINTL
jgi:hypothetical protein